MRKLFGYKFKVHLQRVQQADFTSVTIDLESQDLSQILRLEDDMAS
jgi:hypothetical protein